MHFRFTSATLFAISLAFAAARAQAQSPDSTMVAFRATLGNRSAQELATLLGGSESATRKGFVALEMFNRSTQLEDATLAARNFAAAVKANRNDAWAHFGLGLTLFRAGKTMSIVRTMGVADGQASSVAQRELEKALDLDPGFTQAAEVLAVLAEKEKDGPALERARAVLGKAGRNVETAASAETSAQTTTTTTTSTTTAPARPSGSAQDYMRRAQALFGNNDPKGGAEAYFAGVEVWDRDGVDMYIRDVLVTASPEEALALTSVKTATLQDRAATLRFFWKKRAVRDGVSAGERIQEHYRRLAFARENYKRGERRGGPPPGAVIKEKPAGIANEIDDRGLVYVRYGEPYDRVRATNALTRSNSTWVYTLLDGSLVQFRFTEAASGSGFYLVSDPVAMINEDVDRFRGGGASAWKLYGSDPNARDASRFFQDVGRYDPRLKLIAVRIDSLQAALHNGSKTWENIAQSIHSDNQNWSRQNERQVRAALQTDAAPHFFQQPLRVFQDVATFRGRGCTDVVYAVAAPVAAYHVSVDIADTVTWQTQGVDSTASKEPGSFGVLCTTPNPNAYVRLTIAADAQTGTTASGAIAIPDYAGRSLLMSDVLFATPESGPFTRGTAHLALAPARQFKQNEPFRVFFELYNIPGHKYRTDITFDIVEADPAAKLSGKKTARVSFDGDASSDVVQELRTVVPDVDPGQVKVTVKVTDLTSNAVANRTETITIVP